MRGLLDHHRGRGRTLVELFGDKLIGNWSQIVFPGSGARPIALGVAFAESRPWCSEINQAASPLPTALVDLVHWFNSPLCRVMKWRACLGGPAHADGMQAFSAPAPEVLAVHRAAFCLTAGMAFRPCFSALRKHAHDFLAELAEQTTSGMALPGANRRPH